MTIDRALEDTRQPNDQETNPGGCDPCQAGCDDITMRGVAYICCICRGVDEDWCPECESRHEERGTEAWADEQPGSGIPLC